MENRIALDGKCLRGLYNQNRCSGSYRWKQRMFLQTNQPALLHTAKPTTRSWWDLSVCIRKHAQSAAARNASGKPRLVFTRTSSSFSNPSLYIHGLLWECYERVSSGSHPQQLPTMLRGNFVFDKKKLQLSHWPWITEHYSLCHLTRLSDKFAAISGLAEIIHRQSGDQYVAVLRRKDLERQLCWYVDTNKKSPYFPDQLEQPLN